MSCTFVEVNNTYQKRTLLEHNNIQKFICYKLYNKDIYTIKEYINGVTL